jgi:hypothetical protein
VKYARKDIGWPEVKTVSIKKVWDWLTKLKGLERGIGEGPAGRAVAALSYLEGEDNFRDSDLDIVWALLGLEALYCSGKSGVMNQLLEKSQVLLGAIQNHKRILRDMYDLRSRVLHGNVDIPLRYSHYDGVSEFQKFHLGTYKAALLAHAMLVASIQKLVERNWTHLSFKYILDSTNAEGLR